MPITVDDRLVGDAAARLRDGGLAYSPRNLYYSLCAIVERPEVPEGTAQIAAGVLLLIATILLGILLASFFVWPILPLGMIVTGFGLRRRRLARSRPTFRPLAIGYDEFVRGVVESRRGSPLLEGMVEPPASAARTAAAPTATLLVCDRAETAVVIAANAAASGLRAEVLAEEAVAPASLPGRSVVALHDCDPSGCGLAVRLRTAGAAGVLDLGLRPGQLFDRRIQILEGAPAVVAGDASRLLSAEEIVWLAEGRRVELAVLPPRDLVDALRTVLAGEVPTHELPGLEGVRLAEGSLVAPPAPLAARA